VTELFVKVGEIGVFYPLFIGAVGLGLGVRYLLRRRIGVARWTARTTRAERWALTLLLLTMLAFAVLQIVLRNLFQTGLVWIEPLLRHLVLWIGFTAAVVAAGRLRHIQMDVIGRVLPPGPRLAVLRFTLFVTAVICMVLARASWIYLGQELEFGSTGFLDIPVWLLTSVLFLGFALMASRFLTRMLLRNAPLLELLQAEHGETPADGKVAS
jgi:TRAP-type C4-dicarboxylate transport system permease small subunit